MATAVAVCVVLFAGRLVAGEVEAPEGGAFLTDGARLFRVMDRSAGEGVWLEDCAKPDAMWELWPVRDVVARLRLVRPARV